MSTSVSASPSLSPFYALEWNESTCDTCDNFDNGTEFIECFGEYSLNTTVVYNETADCLNFTYRLTKNIEVCNETCDGHGNGGVRVSIEIHPGWDAPQMCFPHNPQAPLHPDSDCMIESKTGDDEFVIAILEAQPYDRPKVCVEHFNQTDSVLCKFPNVNGEKVKDFDFMSVHACYPGGWDSIGIGHSMLHLDKGSGCCSQCVIGPVCYGDTCMAPPV